MRWAGGDRNGLAAVAAADAVLLILDGSEALTGDDRELVARLAGRPLIPAVNKTDLPAIVTEEDLSRLLSGRQAIRISAKYGNGMEELLRAIKDHFLAVPGGAPPAGAVITTLRHKLALEKASFFISQATARATRAGTPELIAADLQEALDALDEITGRNADDMILDRIFANFCVGK